MDSVCQNDENSSADVVALLAPLPALQLQEYFQKLINSRGCNGIEVKHNGTTGKAEHVNKKSKTEWAKSFITLGGMETSFYWIQKKRKKRKKMSTKMIVLKSSDNVEFQIEEDVASQCLTIAHWIDDENTANGVPLTNVKGNILEVESTNNVIPLPEVKGNILALVTEYCKKHIHDAKVSDAKDADTLKDASSNELSEEQRRALAAELKEWDDKWFMNLQTDSSTLFELILAANYLNNKTLLDRACQAVADMITEKTVEQIRTDFNIEKGYTNEEEREVLEKNKWALD